MGETKTPQISKQPPARQCHILFVGGDEDDWKVFRDPAFQRRGIEVHLMRHPQHGLEFARTRPLDLIFMDLNLSVMDGYQALEMFRADQATRHVPVIAVSAFIIPKAIEKTRAAGFADLLGKPLEARQLLVACDRLLGRTIH